MAYEGNHVEALMARISSLEASLQGLVQKLGEMTSQKDEEVVYNLADLVRILKVTPRTLYAWRAKGILPMTEIGGTPYITKKRLQEIIDGNPKMGKGGVQ